LKESFEKLAKLTDEWILLEADLWVWKLKNF
jgi:hypothetical protein